MIENTIGQRIKKYRQLKELTQQELADAIGRTKSSIQKYEADRTDIPSFTLFRIADALGVSEDILRNGEPQIVDPITELIKHLIQLTEDDVLKWQKERISEIRQDSKRYFGQKFDKSKIEFLREGANDDEELEDLYFLGGLKNDQYYLTKIESKEKYNLYGYHSDLIETNKTLVYFGSTETYPLIEQLYISARVNSEGKFSVYSFLERAKDFPKE